MHLSTSSWWATARPHHVCGIAISVASLQTVQPCLALAHLPAELPMEEVEEEEEEADDGLTDQERMQAQMAQMMRMMGMQGR